MWSAVKKAQLLTGDTCPHAHSQKIHDFIGFGAAALDDRRSFQSRSCPWFFSGVLSPHGAHTAYPMKAHILFGRSFRCQGSVT